MMKKRKPTKNAVETNEQFHIRMMTAYLRRDQRMKQMVRALFRGPAPKRPASEI
jgi:hypothetical protein